MNLFGTLEDGGASDVPSTLSIVCVEEYGDSDTAVGACDDDNEAWYPGVTCGYAARGLSFVGGCQVEYTAPGACAIAWYGAAAAPACFDCGEYCGAACVRPN